MSLLRLSGASNREGMSRFGPHPPPRLQLAGKASKAGNVPANGFAVAGPLTKLTQEDQDNIDEEKQRESIRELVQTWMDRLHLITFITTFFASMEAILLGLTIPRSTDPHPSATGQAANITLVSALVVHVHAAVISFVAAFFLIRYKLAVVEKEERKAEQQLVTSPTSITTNDLEEVRPLIVMIWRQTPFKDLSG